ncbi:hypothetical protein I6N90_06735 [Paenibacillus sp. GSMTC-2017]|uniref:hypothetical protein n=1 Tax=Paenibacillus sp. GSMTC-2017 TaxID=2794350 RepID=UPI0018D769F5|nr:hypothetical protein [Paenibacillus sp. GSMTC-2017]MBH5317511.1 hypothetical protein [Paenibacillus sp. GSMTC-2017]
MNRYLCPCCGPHANYSLTEARDNFKKNYTMYRNPRYISKQTNKEVLTKEALIRVFEKPRYASNDAAQQLRQEIDTLKKVLDKIVHESTKRYSDNIRKNQLIINLINSDKPEVKVNGLLSLALNARDGDFVQDMMVQYSQHKNENVRGIAIRIER